MGGTLQEFKIEDCNNLPAGFRFCPTDGEIIHHYLLPKVMDDNFVAVAMGEVDLNSCEPWDLPKKAKMVGESESYFYCLKDRKYPTGTKTNRATEAGFWKATGKDKNIFRGKGVLVGLKKTLVFHRGRAPTGQKTNWIMHEYRLAGKSWNLPKSAKFEWVVCRIFNRKPTKERKTQQDASSTPTKAHGNGYVTLDSLSSQVGYPGNIDTNGNCSFKIHQYPSFLNPQSSTQVESFLDQKMNGEIISAPPLVAQYRTGQFETNRTSAMEFNGGQQSHDQFTLGEFLNLENMWTC